MKSRDAKGKAAHMSRHPADTLIEALDRIQEMRSCDTDDDCGSCEHCIAKRALATYRKQSIKVDSPQKVYVVMHGGVVNEVYSCTDPIEFEAIDLHHDDLLGQWPDASPVMKAIVYLKHREEWDFAEGKF